MKSKTSFRVFFLKQHRKNSLKNIFFPSESVFLDFSFWPQGHRTWQNAHCAMVSLSFLSTLGKIGTLGKFVFPHLCKFITFVIFRLMVKFHFCQVHCPISFVISHPLANLPFLYLFCKFVIFVTFIFSANMPSSGYRFIIQSIMAFWQMTEK